jgi:4-hydroxybenzoate polyprenyltransferase
MSSASSAAGPRPSRTGLLAVAVDFARPFTLLAPWLGFLSSGIAGLGTLPAAHATTWAAWFPVLVGSLMSATLNAASNTLNQIYDRDVDAVNKPGRPIPSGRAGIGTAWVIALIFYAAALVMAWLADPPAGTPGHGRHQCFVIVLVAAFLTWAYSAPPLRTKRLGWGANLTIAIPRGVLLKVAGWSAAVDILHPEPWWVGLVFGLFLLGATTTKDFADVEGDRAGGCRTLPVVLGPRKAALITAPFFVFPFLLIPLGAALGILTGNAVALTVLGFAMAAYGTWIARMMLADPDSLAIDDNHPSWKHMYIMMFVGQIGFAVAYWL